MNISETEAPIRVITKTCGCRENNKRKVTYALVESYHSLCLDKKDIVYAELEACEKLLKYTLEEDVKKDHGTEIAELKMALDLLS
jgi:hypothetical protein